MDPATALSDKEAQAVCELRLRVVDALPELKNDYLRHDLALIRFLRARSLNLDKAEGMLRKHVEWRKKNRINEILNRKLNPTFEMDYPTYYCGKCRAGYPVIMFNSGRYDIRRAVESGLRDEFRDYLIWYFELFLDFSRQQSRVNQYFDQFIMISDLDGLEFRQLASHEVLELGKEITKIFEANYPELLRCGWVVNAPTIFQVVWALITPILSDHTLSKLKILGSNRQKWRGDWTQFIDPDNFPSKYGGANTISVQFRSWLTLEELNRSVEFSLFPDEDFEVISVEPGKYHRVEINVEADSRLEWQFRTERYDIGFSVQTAKGGDVVPYARVDSHLYLQKGLRFIEQDGTYILTFNNSYSKMTRKTLKFGYRITSETSN